MRTLRSTNLLEKEEDEMLLGWVEASTRRCFGAKYTDVVVTNNVECMIATKNCLPDWK